jgi:hypothetical protein
MDAILIHNSRLDLYAYISPGKEESIRSADNGFSSISCSDETIALVHKTDEIVDADSVNDFISKKLNEYQWLGGELGVSMVLYTRSAGGSNSELLIKNLGVVLEKKLLAEAGSSNAQLVCVSSQMGKTQWLDFSILPYHSSVYSNSSGDYLPFSRFHILICLMPEKVSKISMDKYAACLHKDFSLWKILFFRNKIFYSYEKALREKAVLKSSLKDISYKKTNYIKLTPGLSGRRDVINQLRIQLLVLAPILDSYSSQLDMLESRQETIALHVRNYVRGIRFIHSKFNESDSNAINSVFIDNVESGEIPWLDLPRRLAVEKMLPEIKASLNILQLGLRRAESFIGSIETRISIEQADQEERRARRDTFAAIIIGLAGIFLALLQVVSGIITNREQKLLELQCKVYELCDSTLNIRRHDLTDIDWKTGKDHIYAISNTPYWKSSEFRAIIAFCFMFFSIVFAIFLMFKLYQVIRNSNGVSLSHWRKRKRF